MSAPVVLIPGAPVLVPELAGSAARENAAGIERIATMLGEAGRDATGILVVGTDPRRRAVGSVRTSTARWGVGVPVGRPDDPVAEPGVVPDPAVIAWWALDRVGTPAPRRFLGVDGRESGVPRVREGDLVVVVADGPASLTPRAPVPEDPRGVALDEALAAWVTDGGDLPDPGPAVADEVGWWSRPSWLALHRLVGARRARDGYSWAPFGVGYHAARWDRDA